MDRLSPKKRVAVVRDYLSGLSYDEIAAKHGVSKGTVANVAADLKAGRFPEAADTAEHIELLRELSVELKRLKLTPGQCATGVIVLGRINQCGLDPVDIDRWPLILKSVRNEDEAQEFVSMIYRIEEVESGVFAIHGKGIELLIERFDLENEEALRYIESRLRSIGVLGALERAGFKSGNDIEIAGDRFQLDI